MPEIKNRTHALAILDLPEEATEEQIKTAYREMVRQFHPDANPGEDTRAFYDNVQAAYTYLQSHPAPPPMKIFGNETMMETEAKRRKETMLRKERERRREVKEKKEQKERLREREEKLHRRLQFEEEEERLQRADEQREQELKAAMKQIKVLRATRALEAMWGREDETE